MLLGSRLFCRYFIVKFRKAITLAEMQIFRCDKKRWIENEEYDTSIGRSKIVTLITIRHLIIFRYMATVSQFSNFNSRGEVEREKSKHGTAR